MNNPTSRDELYAKIDKISEGQSKLILTKLLKEYVDPAFGTLPKREVDIAFFQALQSLGLFDETPDLYALVSSLRITRSKARNLLYESNLRKTSLSSLDDELIEYLKDPILLKESDKVCLEIGNPLLVDHLKHILKEIRHITDGSFSPELVKLTPAAYIALLNKKLARVSKKEIDRALIECGAKKDVNAKTLLTSVLKTIGKKVAADVGDSAGELVGDYLGDLLSGSADVVKNILSSNNPDGNTPDSTK